MGNKQKQQQNLCLSKAESISNLWYSPKYLEGNLPIHKTAAVDAEGHFNEGILFNLGGFIMKLGH